MEIIKEIGTFVLAFFLTVFMMVLPLAIARLWIEGVRMDKKEDKKCKQ